MVSTPEPRPSAIVRGNRAGLATRARSFLDDVRSTLKDGGWHEIDGKQLCAVHNTASDSLTFLVSMKCVEKRKTKRRTPQYRRLPSLAYLTTEVFINRMRELRRENALRVAARKLTQSPAPAENETLHFADGTPYLPPAGVGQLDHLIDDPDPEPAPCDLESTPGYLILHNQSLASEEVFPSEAEAAIYISEHGTVNQDYLVVRLVGVYKTSLSVIKAV